jgi:Raf kinase inhibitor-like YbhB/YbcL family protein
MRTSTSRRPAWFALVLVCASTLCATAAVRAADHPDRFVLTSPDVVDNGFLTAANAGTGKSQRGDWACGGQDVSPALAWANAPAGTKSFAVIMDDPDAASGRGGTHWLAYDIPASVNALPRNAGSVASGSLVGGNNGRTTTYNGPCAEPDAKTHHFLWMVFALDIPPGTLAPGLTQAQFMQAIDGHNLAEASLVTRFAPRSK